MTWEESILSSLKFVRDEITGARTAINAMVNSGEAFQVKLDALVAALGEAGDIPQSIKDAVSDLVDTSKGMSAGVALLSEVPSNIQNSLETAMPGLPFMGDTENGKNTIANVTRALAVGDRVRGLFIEQDAHVTVAADVGGTAEIDETFSQNGTQVGLTVWPALPDPEPAIPG